MTNSFEVALVELPYKGPRLKSSKIHSSHDDLRSFMADLRLVSKLPRSEFPTRYGASAKLTHDSELKNIQYNEIYLLLVKAGFTSGYGTFTENSLSVSKENDSMLNDIVLIPGTDIRGEVIQKENGLFEYLWRRTFTNPVRTR
jgi:hypothetical protein